MLEGNIISEHLLTGQTLGMRDNCSTSSFGEDFILFSSLEHCKFFSFVTTILLYLMYLFFLQFLKDWKEKVKNNINNYCNK